MKKRIHAIALLSFCAFSLSTQASVQKILFGSCSHQDKAMPVFNAINKENADLFIFLGDNVYGDTENMDHLANKYELLGKNNGFSTLRKNTPTIAIWDDHDFGENDAGAEYPKKEASRKIMLDFWEEPKNSPRYSRPDGIYTSYMYGNKNEEVHVIMPDLRWNRDKLNSVGKVKYFTEREKNNMGPYSPSESSTASMLGEKQWQWIEQELQKPSKIKVIASSLQVLPEFTGWESWANFPNDRKRLFTLIEKYQVNGVVIVSGDTHWGEVSKVTQDVAYPLWEVTSSGLTEEWKNVSPNKHRVGKYTNKVNYGEMLIDWTLTNPLITLSLKDVNGSIFTKKQITLSSISPYSS